MALALTGVAVGWALARWRPTRIEVAGDSMRPTLEPGDRLLVVGARRVGPGALVAVLDPRPGGRLLVKRVVAVAPDGRLEVRGDEPERSTDSRDFGPVSRAAVRGRVVYRYHPDHRRGRLR